ncbi:hypothetical protein FXO38_15603 [Capsicum annuum]|uniref:Aldehyde oxidase/xanthine dehydrogenase second molybdopterin binding domain-containing protein n=1 Tax=Capsicum annuum TaxID=4072 RepID=A0A2G3AKQ2_CAPAN|nr:hypothetical protein FXO37_18303 [Capsicum annuum]KAF3653512.1 hypothetical protein FXO38_15603 [Capsicum annuum]PHT94811.1 hypothetical protein T459_02693 [Capsicum annuum]
MAAYALGLIESSWAKDLLEKVRVIQADTLSIVQGGFTAGSTTSESSCEAVRLCCSILVERLTPVKKQLQDKNVSIDWPTLISQAQMQSVNLAANSYYVPESGSMSYLNFGAAVSEVNLLFPSLFLVPFVENSIRKVYLERPSASPRSLTKIERFN